MTKVAPTIPLRIRFKENFSADKDPLLTDGAQSRLISVIPGIPRENAMQYRRLNFARLRYGQPPLLISDRTCLTASLSDLAFGPVPSRRLGRSLGVNNIPAKNCTYSCLYCQLGTAPTRFERRTFYAPEEVFQAVRERLVEVESRGEGVDYVTFVPDGEPTLDSNLGREIEMLKALGVRVAVLTNSSLLFLREVRQDLLKADLVSVKVDASTERVWRLVDRPNKSLVFKEVIEGLKEFSREFKGTLLTETMLIDGVDYAREEADGIAALIAQLAPSRAYVAVPTRPPAEPWVRPASESQVNAVFQSIQKRVKEAELLIGEEVGTFGSTGDARKDLLATMAVHPMTEPAVAELLKRDGASWELLGEMLNQGEIVRLFYNGKAFYMKRMASRHEAARKRVG